MALYQAPAIAWSPPPHVPYVKPDCASLVQSMVYSFPTKKIAATHGLTLTTFSHEDNARSKNSTWGPCTSTMTLSSQGRPMPLIKRTSIYVDETWDVEIENVLLVVGNQNGTELRTVTLKEYLANFRSYMHNSSSWKGERSSLLSDDDKHVICSAQACFLSIPKEGEAKFNVAIANHQSYSNSPAVLAIVASANGTSAQVLTGGLQNLYHNKNGEKASFVGQRLSDHREEIGSELSADSPMSASEKQQNMLLIIQVPLKQADIPKFMRDASPPSSEGDKKVKRKKVADRPRGGGSRAVDVESAIVKVGESEGPHREVGGFEIERDTRFPVRVTMQFYKATSNGAVDDRVMSEISSELQSARECAVAISSLVTETTNRTTEHNVHSPPYWWNAFWLQHSNAFPHYKTSSDAANFLFSNNRFMNSKLSDVREQILELLGSQNAPASLANLAIEPASPPV